MLRVFKVHFNKGSEMLPLPSHPPTRGREKKKVSMIIVLWICLEVVP